MKKSGLLYFLLFGVVIVAINILLFSCSKDRRRCNDPNEPYYCGKWNMNKVCSSLPFVFVGTPYNNPNVFNTVGFSSIEMCYQFSANQYQYQYFDCKSCYIEQ